MGGEGESGGEDFRSLVKSENGAVSALPGCVLQMTLKSSCSQTASPRPSLSLSHTHCLSLSVATAMSVLAVARCRLSAPLVGREGERERGGNT